MIFILLTGCARTVVTMTSTPTEAHAIINEGIHRFTPFTVNYSNSGGKIVYFSLAKEEYKKVTGFITKDGEVFQHGHGMIVPKAGVYNIYLEKKLPNK